MFLGRSITLFRLLGFAIRLDPSWIFIAGLVTWSLAVGLFPAQFPGLPPAMHWLMGVLGAVGLFASIVFHELSHALVARRFGMEMRGITLFIFGGVAEMTEEPPSPRAEFVVAAAGPLSSLVLAVILVSLYLLLQDIVGQWVEGVLGYLSAINLVLALFNTIPAFPLDGGRMLRAVLWGRRGSIRQATRIASKLGTGFGLLLVVIGGVFFVRGSFVGGVWWVLVGLFLRGAAQGTYRQLVLRRALEGEPVSRFMTRDPVTVDPDAYVRDVVEGFFYRTHHKIYPVVDRGALEGCVTLSRVKDIPREKWAWTRVKHIAEACSEKNTIAPEADAMEAMTRMRRHNVSRLMVVEGGRLVGVISLKDLMHFLSMKVELESG